MTKTILIILISVSIFGILVFSIVRQIMQKKIDELVKNQKKQKKTKP
tara:strand:- start:180 stop:320 length:141 start_codon:yes stop_codon:yes gene_type:complete